MTHSIHDRGRVLSGTISLAVGTAAAQALTALAFLGLARHVNTAELGTFGAAYALSTFAGTAIDFGSSTAETRRRAGSQNLDGFRSWMIRRAAYASSAVVPVWIALSLMSSATLTGLATFLLAAQTLAIVVASGALAATRALRSPVEASWLVAVGNLVFLIGCLVPSSDRLQAAATGAVGSWVVTLAASLVLLRRSSRRTSAPPPTNKNPWRGSGAFGVFALSANSYVLLVPITAAIAGASAAGQLAAVNRWVQPVMLLPLSFSGYMFPRWSRAESASSVWASLRRALPLLGLSCGVVVAIVISSRQLVDALIGAEYSTSVSVLRLLAIASVPALIAQPVTIALQAIHEDRFVAQVGVGTSVACLAMTALLAAPLGAAASAPALAVTATAAAVLVIRRLSVLAHQQ